MSGPVAKRGWRKIPRERSAELHPEAGGGAHMGLLDQHWMHFIIFQCWFAFFSSLGFELALVCVYTSCHFFSLRHTASLWNKALIGTAAKVPKCALGFCAI